MTQAFFRLVRRVMNFENHSWVAAVWPPGGEILEEEMAINGLRRMPNSSRSFAFERGTLGAPCGHFSRSGATADHTVGSLRDSPVNTCHMGGQIQQRVNEAVMNSPRRRWLLRVPMTHP
jgi:hypothetical protein